MSSMNRYAIPITDKEWSIPGTFDTRFRWEYEDTREMLTNLYRKGVDKQWSATERIDWTQDLDPENPQELPDEAHPLFGSDMWNKMTKKEKATARHHHQAHTLSQFMHGEQGALICTAKIVQQVPMMDSKFYAATQVMDEARHVEVYSKLLHEKFELAYGITPPLKALLEQILSDSRWDMTYLGMQILVEGLALAAFAGTRDMAKNSLAASVNAYVMQDEARHVAFGRLALRDYYPHLTQAERDEREEFVVEACYFMRDRFEARECWERLGLDVDKCIEWNNRSEGMQEFRGRLFTRIVPTVKDIGLWGPKVQKAYADMGIMDLADLDVQAMSDDDERVAEQFDASMRN